MTKNMILQDVITIFLCVSLQIANAFLLPMGKTYTAVRRSSPDTHLHLQQDMSEVEDFLIENYAAFHTLLKSNDDIWKALGDGDGYTLFAPSAAAFGQLSEKELEQLSDPRNLETAQKIGAYHAIAETVTADALFNSGGIITLGGELPVDRSTSGGMFGLGGKEDGGVIIGSKAKVTQSMEVGPGIIHEVNDLVSPKILWRYMDQLRIPGSN